MIELQKQCDALDQLRFSRLYHSTGTGGTMAGLHAGRAMLGMDTQIISVAASPKEAPKYLDKTYALCRARADRQRRVARPPCLPNLKSWGAS